MADIAISLLKNICSFWEFLLAPFQGFHHFIIHCNGDAIPIRYCPFRALLISLCSC